MKLTGSSQSEVGSIWFVQPIYIVGFNSTFTVRFKTYPPGEGRGGLAFVIQNEGVTDALGPSDAGIGYGDATSTGSRGIKNSIAIEFDTHEDVDVGDPDGNHISVHSRWDLPNSALESASLARSSNIPILSSDQELRFSVLYRDGSLKVQILKPYSTGFIISEKIDILGHLNLQAGDPVWIGMTAATGPDGGDSHIVVDWEYTYDGHLSAADTVSTGAGLTHASAGVETGFQVQVLDQFKNKIDCPNAVIDVHYIVESDDADAAKLLQNSTLDVKVVYVGDGLFNVTYTETLAGRFDLAVLVNGSEVAHSPFALDVAPGDAYATHCQLTVLEGHLTAGVDVDSITIDLFDVYNNSVPAHKSLVSVVIEGDNELAHTLSVDGSRITVALQPLTVGDYTAHVELSDTEEIIGQEVSLTVASNEIDPEATVLSGNATDGGGAAGNLWEVQLVTHDHYNNLNVTDALVEATLTTPDDEDDEDDDNVTIQSLPVIHVGDGVYTTNVSLTLAGQYSLSLTVNGGHVSGSPFALKVASFPTPEPANSKVSDVVELSVAGEFASLQLLAIDKYGNPMTAPFDASSDEYLPNGCPVNVSSAQWKLNLVAHDVDTTPPVETQFTCHSAANWTFSWNATFAANYSVLVTYADLPTDKSPYFTRIVHGEVFAGSCYLENFVSHVQSGGAGSFNLFTRDRFANVIAASETPDIEFTFLVHTADDAGHAIKYKNWTFAKVADPETGSWQVFYDVGEVGNYYLHVLHDNQPIADSPFALRVEWAGPSNFWLMLIGFGSIGLLAAAFIGFYVYRKVYVRNQRRDYETLQA